MFETYSWIFIAQLFFHIFLIFIHAVLSHSHVIYLYYYYYILSDSIFAWYFIRSETLIKKINDVIDISTSLKHRKYLHLCDTMFQIRTNSIALRWIRNIFVCALRIGEAHPRSSCCDLAATPRLNGKRTQLQHDVGDSCGGANSSDTSVRRKRERTRKISSRWRL